MNANESEEIIQLFSSLETVNPEKGNIVQVQHLEKKKGKANIAEIKKYPSKAILGCKKVELIN